MITLLFGLLLGITDLGQAEEAYHAGRYGEALAAYQAVLPEPGAAQGAVLYNMGNCAYRMGRYAEAALFYRCAQLRLPRDRSIAFNLSLAEQQLGLDTPERESFGKAMVALMDSFTPGQCLALVGVLQCVGLAGLVLLRRRRAACYAMALVVLLALAGAARLAQTQWFPVPAEGVVLNDEIALRPEPHVDLNAVHELEAGETVCVMERSDRWIRVVHEKGEGWTERAGVGIVD
jgi:tetratricopeptide (TPR) repeat protein